MKGIDAKYRLEDPVERSGGGAESKEQPGGPLLPTQLHDALSYFEKSALMKETLGDVLFGKFIANKKLELARYNRFITDYEIQEYLPIL